MNVKCELHWRIFYFFQVDARSVIQVSLFEIFFSGGCEVGHSGASVSCILAMSLASLLAELRSVFF